MSPHYQQTLGGSWDGRNVLVVLGIITIALLALAAIEIVIAIAIGATLAQAVTWVALSIIL
jgi:hypothetical protein